MLCTQRQPCAANVLAGCVVAWVGWQAPGEGEAMCVALEQARIVDGIITKDTDALLFGARLVITHTEIAAQKNVRPGSAVCRVVCFALTQARRVNPAYVHRPHPPACAGRNQPRTPQAHRLRSPVRK